MATIVTRTGKGSPLTHVEVDTNFTNLNTNKLEAGAIALGSAATPSISFTGDTNTGIYSPGADQLAVATNGTGRLFVNANGRVGVMVTPSTTFFHVYTDAPGTVSAPTICLEGGFNGYGAGIDFASRTSSGGTLVSMAKITADGEAAWNTTASTQDANLRFFTAENGSLGERLRITSTGALNFVGAGTAGSTQAVSFNGSAPVNSLVIDSSGRLGIGNSSPSSYNASSDDLVVGDHVGAHGVTICSQNNSSGYIMFADGTTGAQAYAGQITYDHTNNRLTLGTNDGTTGLTVDSSQRVGIGVTGPNSVLQVNSGTNLGGILIGFNAGSSNFYDADLQVFRTGNGTERARIDSSGRMLVGTPTALGTGQVGFLTSGANQVLTMHNSNATPYGLVVKYTAATPNGTAAQFVYLEDASALRCEIRSNGGIANYSANDANLSDRNVKKDIALAAGTWDCIKEWEIVNYRYKDQPDDAELNLGVIAQQVAESCPEVITIFQEAKEATEDKPAQEERLGVREQQMYWMAIKALQEAMERIEQLETEMAAVKAQLA